MTPGLDTAVLLGEIRAALGRPDAPPPAIPVDHALARVCGPGDDLVPLFTARARAAGLTVQALHQDGLHAALTGLLVELGARAVAVSDDTGCDAAAACRDAGARLVCWDTGERMLPLFEADAGITGVQGAIAETGSLVCEAAPGHSRGLSLAPPVHIAIVRASQIVPDLLDWATRTRPGLPSCITLISGPSKTADIEGVLVTGVHGPRRVHVLLVNDQQRP